MPVSEEFVEFLSEGAVAIEVYGHKQANPRRNLALWDLGVIQAKTRSLRERLRLPLEITPPTSPLQALTLEFGVERWNGTCPRRWSEVTRRLELWVQLRELNEAGEFTAVEVLPAKDVRTGGVFQLRQVWVLPWCGIPRLQQASVWVTFSPLAGSVPSGPGGGAVGPRLGHPAPHRHLHPLHFHRRRQSSADASVQRRIAAGLLGQNKTCSPHVLFVFVLINKAFFQ